MFEKIQTLVGYATAPRAAYVLKHPIRSVRLLRMRRSLKNAVSPRLA
ncbi:MAG: hypothetical protein HY561_09090, partial [Gemmatimonadetes bacterium]|nr:hypothetical protein [Gemmatimonadota bacterium]